MMGYTHAAWGAAGAVTLAAFYGDGTPQTYLTATVAGFLGGVVIDAEVKDQRSNPKVTDAGRTRLAGLGAIGLLLLLDYFFNFGIIKEIVSRKTYAEAGLCALIVIILIGHFSPHRTFTHSLLYIALTSAAVYGIYPKACAYFAIGCALHLLLDMLNHPVFGAYGFNDAHGVMLLYPMIKGKGIALKWCKAGRTGNKVFYFIGISQFATFSVAYLGLMGNANKAAAPIILLAYVIIILHFVRTKSEREQRHIMHMHGEL